jgi:pyruvate/2-oxoglutarate dehydrogenase complex dihydrolipoamide acyltransferase (E2) component
MAKQGGRSLSISRFRRLVIDQMNFGHNIPSVTAERRMDLSAVAAARQLCTPRPTWVVLFAKAFALAARSFPELRRSYMTFPWPRFYEHPSSTVTLNVERQFAGEDILVQCLIRRPDNRSLAELDAIVRHYQEEPVENLRWYRRAMAMSKLPWPLRPLLWWGALNVFGRRRCHNFGTFGLTSVGAFGAGIIFPMQLVTSILHYGMFDKAGNLDVRLSFDHRVFDGGPAARFLVELDRRLQEDILVELTRMRTEGVGSPPQADPAGGTTPRLAG